MKKVDIAKLPKLKTSVGIHGSFKQTEVGGGGCTTIMVMLVSGQNG